MSEATNSEHRPAKAGSTDSASPAWFADWADFSIPPASEPDTQDPAKVEPSIEPAAPAPVEEWNDWQTVNFPNAISADAIDRQSLYTDAPPQPERPKAAAPSIALPNWGRSKPAPTVAQTPTQASVTSAFTHGLSNGGPSQVPPSRVPRSQELPSPVPPSQVPVSQEPPSQVPPSQVPPLAGQSSVAQPNVADLISLIQELNQCNSALIDRVSHLEDALDRSEAALQAEIGRSQEQVLVNPQELAATQEQLAITQTQLATTQEQLATTQEQSAAAQEQLTTTREQLAAAYEQLAAAHEHVTQLTHQLEFTAQTQQRQQILVETLTTQLENSQERVAQLERDCAALQQQYNEQTHALTQSENTSRDLYARLHRQQRYTLQYKAALEKCLEVPPPSYESGADVGAAVVFRAGYEAHHLAPQSFLPKAQRIQPWSTESRSLRDTREGSLTGKLEALVNSPIDTPPTESELSNESNPFAFPAMGHFSEGQGTASQPAMAQDRTQDSTVEMTDEEIEATLLNATAQPLTDLSPEAIQAGLDELQSVLDDFLSGKSEAPTEAELTLWQDLARLIEVSTDDVVKASVAQNFESFTASEADLTESVLDTLTDSPSPADLSQQKVPPSAIPPKPSTSANLSEQKIPPRAIPVQQFSSLKLPMSAISPRYPQGVAAKIAAHANQNGAVLSAQSSTPSPLVYPLRPSKKLSSLAAVDLPTFPRKNED